MCASHTVHRKQVFSFNLSPFQSRFFPSLVALLNSSNPWTDLYLARKRRKGKRNISIGSLPDLVALGVSSLAVSHFPSLSRESDARLDNFKATNRRFFFSSSSSSGVRDRRTPGFFLRQRCGLACLPYIQGNVHAFFPLLLLLLLINIRKFRFVSNLLNDYFDIPLFPTSFSNFRPKKQVINVYTQIMRR